jgi:hypothetical protein
MAVLQARRRCLTEKRRMRRKGRPTERRAVTITNNLDIEIRPQRTPYHLAPHIGFEAIKSNPCGAPIPTGTCGTRGEGRSGAARLRAS